MVSMDFEKKYKDKNYFIISYNYGTKVLNDTLLTVMVGMSVLSNSRLKRNFETNVRQIKSRFCAVYFLNWIYF